MANEQHLAILQMGLAAWNEWRTSHPSIQPDLSDAVLTNSILTDATLSDAALISAPLRRTDLSNAILTGANLTDANLKRANLTRATLIDATLARANLTDATLTGADLTRAILTDATLTHATLTGAALTGATLTGATLTGASLTGATLNGATLNKASLINSRMLNANVVDAQLNDANLTRANLAGANMTRASLINTNLTEATFHETVLTNVDLSKASGLDYCHHVGPSSVDYRTLLLSGSSMSLKFLRGCGLPDRLIDYLPSLLEAGPIQFYSCFISYSTANQDFADRLYSDLQNNGVRCWFAPHNMLGGKRIYDQVDEAIRAYDRLLLILSPESMSSAWVSTEIAKAREKEIAERRNVLFPIALVPFNVIRDWHQFDADVGDDSAKRIREYFVPDFSDWKNHDAYQQSFERLLKALKS